MGRIVLNTCLFFLALALVGCVALGIAIAMLDPNKYKPHIADAIEEKTGLKVLFDGDLQVSMFPVLGLTTGRIRVADNAVYGSEPFVRVEHTTMELALFPLFQRRVEIKEVLLEDVFIKPAISQTGLKNWEIDRNLEQRIQERLAEGIEALDDPEKTKAKQQRSAQADGLSFHADTIKCSNLQVVYRDLRNNSGYAVDIPSFLLTDIGTKPEVEVRLSGVARDLVSEQEADFSLDATLKFIGAQHMEVEIDSLEMDFGTPEAKLGLKKTAVALNLSDSSVKVENFQGSFAGMDFSGKALGRLPGNSDLEPSLSGGVTLEAEVPHLDADVLLAALAAIQKKPPRGQAASSSGREASSRPATAAQAAVSAGGAAHPLAMSAGIALDVKLSAETLAMRKTTFSNLVCEIRSTGYKAELSFSGVAFEGHIAGNAATTLAKINADNQRVVLPPHWKASYSIEKLQAGPALQFLAGKQPLTGTFASKGNIAASGAEPDALLRSLEGTAALQLNSGVLQGIKTLPLQIKGIGNLQDAVIINNASGTFALHQGVAVSNNLRVHSPLFEGSGSGTFNLPAQTLNAKGNVLIGHKPPPVPVVASGSFNAIAVHIDAASLAKDTAAKLLQSPEKTKEALRDVGKDPKKGLRGLKDILRGN